MRRDLAPLLLLLLLALLGGFAWLSRHPETGWVDRAAEWPVLGTAARWFRDAYRPPPPRPPADEPEVEVVVLRPPPPPPPPRRPAEPRPQVWVEPGTAVHAEPDAASPVRDTLRSYANLGVIEQRDDWFRVAANRRDSSWRHGWVLLPDYREPTREELWRPDPVLPLPATPLEPELIAAARELMTDGAREAACGPYLLVTDLAGPGFPASCAALAGGLDRLYGDRYGLAPAGEPAEAIFVFHNYLAFVTFRARVAPDQRRHAFASPARGFVAVAAQGRARDQLLSTVAHELVHLLNRRFLGPALPPWLEEGLADDLALSRVGGRGQLVPGTVGGWETAGESMRTVGGGRAAVLDLKLRASGGRLPSVRRLVAMDKAAFHAAASPELHYALSAFWVRYLLSGEEPALAAGFRSFLAAVAAGEPIGEALLLERLGRGWPELEAGFRGWIEAQDPDASA